MFNPYHPYPSSKIYLLRQSTTGRFSDLGNGDSQARSQVELGEKYTVQNVLRLMEEEEAASFGHFIRLAG